MKYRVEWTLSAVIKADSEEAAFEIACELTPPQADGPFRITAVKLDEEEEPAL